MEQYLLYAATEPSSRQAGNHQPRRPGAVQNQRSRRQQSGHLQVSVVQCSDTTQKQHGRPHEEQALQREVTVPILFCNVQVAD